MCEYFKQVCIVLLCLREFLAAKRISLNNQPSINRPALINLNPNKTRQGLHHYPFIVSLDRCKGRCNTIDDPSSKICVPNKTEDVTLKVLLQRPC